MSCYNTSFVLLFWIITIVFLWGHGFVGGIPYVGIVGGDAYLNWTIKDLADDVPRLIQNPSDNASLMVFFSGEAMPYIVDKRTAFTGDILRGIVSFTLSNVKLSDAGRYTFIRPNVTNATLILGGQVLIVAESPHTPVIKELSLAAVVEKEYKLNCSTKSRSAPLDHNLTMHSYWKQNGVNVSLESRYIVNGMILTISSLSRKDNGGNVTCHAFEDQRIPSAESSAFFINVLYGPDNVQVTPSGILNVNEGGNMNLTCASECNPSCSSYRWSKDSLLTIVGSSQSYWESEVQRNQSGIYICTITNTNISKSATTQITVIVNYPPVVSINSQNGTYNDTDIALNCSAHGIPGQYVFTLTHISLFTGIKIRQPGFDFVTSSIISYRFSNFMDTGIYTCTVNNGIADYRDGSVNKSVSETVWIKGPPYVTSSITSFHAEKGQSGKLAIEFYNSLLDPNVTWYRYRNQSLEKLDSSDKYSVYISNVYVTLNFYSVSIQQPGINAALDIRNVTPDDFGLYQVNVQNSVGIISPGVLILLPRGPPDVPHDVHIVPSSITASSVGVEWLSGFSSGMNQTFAIEYREHGDTSWTKSSEEVFGGMRPDEYFNITIGGLHQETMYFFRMYAWNSYNRSENSVIINATTTADNKEGNMFGNGSAQIIIGCAVGAVLLTGFAVVIGVVIFKRRTSPKLNADGKDY
ncbi:hypothetical protein ACJMK2_006976 [Sinanodonta woodiana]|uniref:Uncharacterized protein n=1 Tax=Sinanodonta woodiana TaxID=1069815 RepID=A0ABD3VHD3_SINWO